jgi:hypothetical protein
MKNQSIKTNGLTMKQLFALEAWITIYGRTWKAKLRRAWMTGNYDGFECSNILQSLGNDWKFGTAWLTSFNIGKTVLQCCIDAPGLNDESGDATLLASVAEIFNCCEGRFLPVVTLGDIRHSPAVGHSEQVSNSLIALAIAMHWRFNITFDKITGAKSVEVSYE